MAMVNFMVQAVAAGGGGQGGAIAPGRRDKGGAC